MQDQDVATTTTLENTASPAPEHGGATPAEPRTGLPTWVRHTVIGAATAVAASLLTTVVVGTGDAPSPLPAAVADLRAAVTAGASVVSCFEGVHDEFEGRTAADGRIAARSAAVAMTRLGECDTATLAARIEQLSFPESTPIGSRDQMQLSARFGEATDALRATVEAAAAARDAYTGQLEARSAEDPAAERAFAELDTRHGEASSLLFQLEHAVAELHPPRLAPEITPTGQA